MMLRHDGRGLVLLAGLLLCFIPLALIIYRGLKGTGGIFSYPVDDTYIHMQIARNLAQYGSWGMNAGEFNSASSSILYTLLLAGFFKLLGTQLFIPLAINVLAAAALVFFTARWIHQQGISKGQQVFVFALAVFFTPLPVIVLSGMEHSLQLLFSFLFLTRFPAVAAKKLSVDFILITILLVATRYEGLFLVLPACLYLLYIKKIKGAVLLGGLALLPVIVFGLISLSKGSYFFPNSLVVKSEAVQFSLKGMISSWSQIITERLMFTKAGITLLATQRLLMLIPLLLLLFYRQMNKGYKMMLTILLGAVFLQLVLADTGKFYRYEAYLIYPFILVAGILIIQSGWQRLRQLKMLWQGAVLLLAFMLLFPLLLRSLAALTKAPVAIVNIHDQQLQMARFINQFYPGSTIAANDIGAVSFFRNGKIVDLWGLGSLDIARSRKLGYWNQQFLDQYAKSADVAMAVIYDSWIDNSIPQSWIKVASWRIANNVVCGDDIVSFYATDRDGSVLKQQLLAFEKGLPATVTVEYFQ